jgi:nucleobase:cation symporter-1, NCS1 family
VSDYSRYLPRNVGVRASFLWTYCGALLGGAWMMEVGALVAVMNPHVEVAAAVLKSGNSVVSGLGLVLLAAASGGLLTVTSINLYGGSLTLLSAADSIRPIRYNRRSRIYGLLLITAPSTAMALLFKGDYVSGFSDMLTVLLYLFTPWTSINLIDFYFVRRGCYSIREIFKDDGMYGYWNWRGLVAYAAGFISMIPFFSTGFYVGPVARALGGADLAMIVGLPVSAITYLVACRSMDLAAERLRAEEADRGLDSGE